MDGVIVKIEQYPKKGEDETPYVFIVRNENGTETRFQYTGFLPIRQGDVISIGEKMELGGRGKRYILQEKPLVYIPLEPLDLARYFREALVETRKQKSDYFKSVGRGGRGKSYSKVAGGEIYDEMYQKFGDHARIIEALNVWAVEFFTCINEKERNTIYSWWKRNVLRRQLYLIGLYNKEIDDSGLREDVLFERIKQNPMKITTLPVERAVEINNLFQRETTRMDMICGEVIRKLNYYKKKKGWYYVPERIIKKNIEDVKSCYEELFGEYEVILENDNLYTPENYQIETHLASRLGEMIKINKMVERMPSGKKRFKVYGDIELTHEQEEALHGCLRNRVSVITGGAGCGKTTLLKQIVRNLEQQKKKFLLTSFTGKAVMRIKEIITDNEKNKEYESRCITLSRIIHRRKTFQSVPDFDTLITDESSMIGTDLFHTFSQMFGGPFSLILIGDCNQLDPIESGSFFKEVIVSDVVPVYRLTINKRSEGGTVIVKNANGLVAEGRDYTVPYRFIPGEGFYVMDGEVDLVGKIIKGLSKSGVKDKEITILTPVNRYIPILNGFHQKYYLKKAVRFKDVVYYMGDRMMQKKNYYSEDLEIMNGEEGHITNFNEDYLEVTFKADKVVCYRWKEMMKNNGEEDVVSDELTINSITHSFAKTIHKSQGSEYDYVIIYIPPENVSFVSVNMLYTAITRAKKKVWIVSNLSTLDIITTQTLPKRRETLSVRLKELSC